MKEGSLANLSVLHGKMAVFSRQDKFATLLSKVYPIQKLPKILAWVYHKTIVLSFVDNRSSLFYGIEEKRGVAPPSAPSLDAENIYFVHTTSTTSPWRLSSKAPSRGGSRRSWVKELPQWTSTPVTRGKQQKTALLMEEGCFSVFGYSVPGISMPPPPAQTP